MWSNYIAVSRDALALLQTEYIGRLWSCRGTSFHKDMRVYENILYINAEATMCPDLQSI